MEDLITKIAVGIAGLGAGAWGTVRGSERCLARRDH